MRYIPKVHDLEGATNSHQRTILQERSRVPAGTAYMHQGCHPDPGDCQRPRGCPGGSLSYWDICIDLLWAPQGSPRSGSGGISFRDNLLLGQWLFVWCIAWCRILWGGNTSCYGNLSLLQFAACSGSLTENGALGLGAIGAPPTVSPVPVCSLQQYLLQRKSRPARQTDW